MMKTYEARTKGTGRGEIFPGYFGTHQNAPLSLAALSCPTVHITILYPQNLLTVGILFTSETSIDGFSCSEIVKYPVSHELLLLLHLFLCASPAVRRNETKERKRDLSCIICRHHVERECNLLPPIPAVHFTVLEPRDRELCTFYVVQKRRATDFKAPKLWKGRSGHTFQISTTP